MNGWRNFSADIIGGAISHERLAVCRAAAGFRRADPFAGVFERRKSVRSGTWLQTALTMTSQGLFLSWNTQPGFTYQVQVTTNFTSWSNVGAPRFAAGTSDSIYVGGGGVGYYRVVLLR